MNTAVLHQHPPPLLRILRASVLHHDVTDRNLILAVRHRSADLLAYPQGRLQRPFLMATGTKTAPATRIRCEEFVPAVRTPHAGKPLLKVPAFQKLLHDRPNDGPPKTVAFLIALFIGAFKLRIEPLDQLIKRRLPVLARMIKSSPLLVGRSLTIRDCAGNPVRGLCRDFMKMSPCELAKNVPIRA